MRKNHFIIVLLTIAFLASFNGLAAANPDGSKGYDCSRCHSGMPDQPPPVTNKPPVANAGPDQTIEEGEVVTLNGSNSSDPDDGIASYSWRQTAGTSVKLSNAAASRPTFTAPTVGASGGSLTFQLTVTDKGGLRATDTCIVNITPVAVTPVNEAPVANAGPDQNVDPDTQVVLDGSNSTDPDDGIVSYLWKQTGGPAVTLSSTTDVSPSFTAPAADADGASLTFQLTVTDVSGLKSTDTCIVNINSAAGETNLPPVADAGPNQNVRRGQKVMLNGANSSDPDDGIASYRWKQTRGKPVTLSRSTSARPSFKAPNIKGKAASLTFRLTVTDKSGKQSSDTCIVQIAGQSVRGKAPGADFRQSKWYKVFSRNKNHDSRPGNQDNSGSSGGNTGNSGNQQLPPGHRPINGQSCSACH